MELGLCEPDIVGVWLGEPVGEDVNVELGVAERDAVDVCESLPELD